MNPEKKYASLFTQSQTQFSPTRGNACKQWQKLSPKQFVLSAITRDSHSDRYISIFCIQPLLLLCPALIGGGIKRCFCLTSVWHLSVVYIGPKSRTERLRKTKIGIEVAHITRDSDAIFKVKRSKVKVTRSHCSPPCWRIRRLQRWVWKCVGHGEPRCRLLGGGRRFGAHGGRRVVGEYVAAARLSAPMGEESGGGIRGGRPPTSCNLLSNVTYVPTSKRQLEHLKNTVAEYDIR